MKIQSIVTLAALSVLTGAAYAGPGPRNPGVNQRQVNQQGRIAQGVRSGELTRREAGTLARHEAAFARMERRLKSDGTLTAAERAYLQRELNRLSAEIYRQKHDAQAR